MLGPCVYAESVAVDETLVWRCRLHVLLPQVLWLKSRSSEVWLERRTAYTRSTGVMSVVRP